MDYSSLGIKYNDSSVEEDKMKTLINEFKQFVARGNVIDLAVGVIMGAAFTAIVNSLVNGVVMPLVGYAIGGVNFTDFKIILSPASGDIPEVAILYGGFIQQTINFFIVALVVFVILKTLNKLPRKKEEAPKPSAEELLLTEIRDVLKSK